MRYVQGKGTFKALQFDTGCLPAAGRRIFSTGALLFKRSSQSPRTPPTQKVATAAKQKEIGSLGEISIF